MYMRIVGLTGVIQGCSREDTGLIQWWSGGGTAAMRIIRFPLRGLARERRKERRKEGRKE